jgi:hypothetical protein
MAESADGAIRFVWDGEAALGARRRDVPEPLRGTIDAAIDDALFEWGEELQVSWPRDTGRSFANWDSSAQGWRVVLQNPVEYAAFVHPPGGEEGDSWEHMRDTWMREAAAVVREYKPQVQRQPSRRASFLASARTILAGRKQSTTIDLFRGSVAAFQRVSSRERNRGRIDDRPRDRRR